MKIKLGQLNSKPAVRWNTEGHTVDGNIIEYHPYSQTNDEFAVVGWIGVLEDAEGNRYQVDSGMDIQPLESWPVEGQTP